MPGDIDVADATHMARESESGSNADSPRVDASPGAMQASSIHLTVPVTVAEALALAVERHRSDRLREAEAIYRAILAVDPEQADALHLSGVLALQQDRSEEAIALIRRALEHIPGHADAHNNLGNVFRSRGAIEEACACYQRAVALDPHNAVAHSNLGATLRALKRYGEAEAALQRAVTLDPQNADFFQNLGNVYRSQRRLHDAVAAFRQAIALRPYNSQAYKYLAYTLYALKDREEAIRLITHWVDIAPESPTARHLLAAYAGSDVPDRASNEYIRETFKQFAASFDEVLTDLGYRAPQLVAEAVGEVLGPAGGGLRVLDLGCGTGLGGEALRPYASLLVGVDLSPDMLKQASRRAFYDGLCEAELTSYCLLQPDRYDLVVAADTLCYFGRLDDVFAAAAFALAAAGWFVFTVEEADGDAVAGYQLNVHGRYSHHRDDVTRWLNAAGFHPHLMRHATLRHELGAEVAGLVVAARRV